MGAGALPAAVVVVDEVAAVEEGVGAVTADACASFLTGSGTLNPTNAPEEDEVAAGVGVEAAAAAAVGADIGAGVFKADSVRGPNEYPKIIKFIDSTKNTNYM